MPEWSATHPTPERREERLTEQIQNLGAPKQSYVATDRDAYLRRLAGMVYGLDPREGYSRGSTFYHPEMRFRFVFPSGWQIINQKAAVVGLGPQQEAVLEIGLSQEKSVDAAAKGLVAQQGVSTSGVSRAAVNGLPAWTGAFTASTDQGTLQGRASFIEHRGRIYQLIGYSTQANWSRYSAEVQRALSSFGELTDPKALSVQPMRLRIEQVAQGMTLRELPAAQPVLHPAGGARPDQRGRARHRPAAGPAGQARHRRTGRGIGPPGGPWDDRGRER